MRVLYEIDIAGGSVEEATDRMLEDLMVPTDSEGEEPDLPDEAARQEIAEYARRLIEGCRSEKSAIDGTLAQYLKEYDFARLAAIDRNILRIGAFELMFLPDVPPRVTINEAVEIAKIYSTAESGKFVNGVLGRILSDSGKVVYDPEAGKAEDPAPVQIPVVIEETVDTDSEEAKAARTFGQWKLREEPDA